MTSKKNTITFNGKVYDATTGALLSAASEPPKFAVASGEPVPTAMPKKSGNPHSIISAKKVHHSPLTKAKTLRRDMVRNPAKLTKPKKVQSDLLRTKSGSAQVVQHTQRVTDERLERAHQTTKSNLVSRFGNGHSHVVVKKQQPMRVASAPRTKQHTQTQHHSQPSSRDMLLDAALLKSLSHEQPKHHLSKRRHRAARKLGLSPRFVSISTALVAVIAITGFYTYQNIPRFALSIASERAGLDAKYPGFHPQGFAQTGSVSYRPGQVAINFSARDNRTYRVIQGSSNDNSQALNTVLGESTNQPVATHQIAGRTVYITADGSQASWVANGIRYTIEANSVLSTDQLLKIAASL